MQQSKHRPPMSESADAAVQSKRRRVDLGMPRGALGSLSGKGDTNGMLNGTEDMIENVNAADLLRKMLHQHGHNGSAMPDITKNGLDKLEQAKKEDLENKIMTNGMSDKTKDVDDKSSDETEAMESGTDEGSVTGVNNNISIKENCNGSASPTSSTIDDNLKAKRARVENIITSMRKSPTPHSHSDQMASDAPEAKRPKRKQYQPQQQRLHKVIETGNERRNGRRNERRKLKELLGHLQQQLDVLQEKYFDLYEEDNSSLSDDGSDDLDDLKEPIDTLSAIHKCEKQARAHAKKRAAAENAALLGKGGSLRLRDTLKKELARSVYSTVDNIVEKFASKHIENQYSSATPEIADTVPVLQFPNNPQQSPSSNRSTRQTTPHRFDEEQTEAISLVVPSRNRITKASPSERSRTSSPATSATSQLAATEAATANEMLRHPFMPTFLPTSVAIPNPSLHPFPGMSLVSSADTNGGTKEQKEAHDEIRYSNSPLLSYPHHHPFLHGVTADGSSSSEMTPVGHDSFSSYSGIKVETEGAGGLGRGSPDLSGYSRANGTSLISTLTPTHLRKAKLMFFYTRYPSSALLRQHFPDVQFNRHNTSQIIKWFSNFREFYYIQMEKFARQAVSDNVEDVESLVVTRDSELFRVLSLHYNKSNDFHVPEGFLKVATTTLKEFFEAIKLGKDSEPSWKKTIYKVIGKLDEMLPEFFKSPACLEDLE